MANLSSILTSGLSPQSRRKEVTLFALCCRPNEEYGKKKGESIKEKVEKRRGSTQRIHQKILLFF